MVAEMRFKPRMCVKNGRQMPGLMESAVKQALKKGWSALTIIPRFYFSEHSQCPQNIASRTETQKLRLPSHLESDNPPEIELVSLSNAIRHSTRCSALIFVQVLLFSGALVLLPQTPIPYLAPSPFPPVFYKP